MVIIIFTSTTTMTLRPRTTTRAIITVLQCSEQQCIQYHTTTLVQQLTYVLIKPCCFGYFMMRYLRLRLVTFFVPTNYI